MAVDAMRLRDALIHALAGGPAVALTSITEHEVPDEIALIIQTGGTTGAPRSVALSAAALRASADASNERLGATAKDRWSLHLPLNHIAGVNQLLRSIALGTDPVSRSAQFISIVPTQLHRALRDSADLLDQLRNARSVLIGGAQVPESLLDQGLAAGINLVTSYGMTEMCGGCVFDGIPLAGVQAKVVASGQLALSGPMRAAGYLHDGIIESNGAFTGDWFVTSDLGSITSDGRVHIVGRNDDVIISGGEKISTTRVAEFLQSAFPNIEVYAVGVPDEQWGESLRIVIVNSQQAKQITLRELRSLVAESIGRAAAPGSLLLLDEMPLKANGKIDFAFLIGAAATEIYQG